MTRELEMSEKIQQALKTKSRASPKLQIASPLENSIPCTTQSRREFLAKMFMLTGLALGLGSFVYRLGSFATPLIPKPKLKEVAAGKIRDIPKGGAKFFNLSKSPTLIVARDTGSFKAYSAVCPHLGCMVHWNEKEKNFVCPCHAAVFDRDGNVVTGPPPSPLKELQVVLRDDEIHVMIESREEA